MDETQTDEETHPRMRQRREEILKERGRRRRVRYLWALAPLLVVAVGFGLAHTPLLAVDEVRVEGAVRTPVEEIVEAAGVRPGRPMLTLNVGAVERRVRALPWVDEVDVVRDWPTTVRLVVTERSPAAAAMVEGSNFVAWVDVEGRVLHLAGEAPEGMVVVTGLSELPEEGEELPVEAREALRIAAAAPDRVPGALESISTDLVGVLAEGAPGAGARVYFRTAEAVDEKLVALDTVLADVDLSCLATVNLWVPDRPTLTHRPGCS